MARNLSSVSFSEALGIIFMSSDSVDEQCDPFYFSEDDSKVDVRGDTADAFEIVMKSLKILILKALLITLVVMTNRSSLTMEWVRYVAVDLHRSREEPATF